jgi:hypothetical protein
VGNNFENLFKFNNYYFNACLYKLALKEEIDLTDINDFSYSAIMRKLRKDCDEETVKEFLMLYKVCFDLLINNNVEKAGDIALIFAVDLFNSLHPLKLKIEKNASMAEMVSPEQAGLYISNIIKFTLNKINATSHPKALRSIMRKIYVLNENVLAAKRTPPSSSIGQSIAYVKNVLSGNNPQFIRATINNIVKYLGIQ